MTGLRLGLLIRDGMTELLKPYDFQQTIIDRFKDESCAGLFLDCGTGKSLVCSNLIRHKMNQHHEILHTLIFAPIIVLKNWKRELLMSTRIPEENICVVMGSKTKRLRLLQNPKNKVIIINYDAIRTDDIMFELLKFKAKIVVCDESHVIKSRTTKVYKGVRHISKNSLYRYALSGTPVTNSAEDLWSQFMFLDDGETFGTVFFAFRNRYFFDKNAGWSTGYPDWQFTPSLKDEFKEKLHSKSVTIKKQDCLDLPDLVEQTLDVPLSIEQTKHYTRIKKELITWLDGQEDNPLVISNALTKLLRLNELLSGYMKMEDETIVKLAMNPRLDALKTVIEATAPHKVIVFCVFKQNYEDIRKYLEKAKIGFVEIHGSVTASQKLDNVDTFNDMDNDVRVCIANPKSGGVGVNMQAAKYAVFYSRTHSIVDFEQAKARNFRAGSKDHHTKITHYNLVSPGTIDEEILECLKTKKKFAASLLAIKKLLT